MCDDCILKSLFIALFIIIKLVKLVLLLSGYPAISSTNNVKKHRLYLDTRLLDYLHTAYYQRGADTTATVLLYYNINIAILHYIIKILLFISHILDPGIIE